MMGRFDVKLLDTDLVFQTLLTAALPMVTVLADLDAESYGDIPLVTHTSFASQDANGKSLWDVQLTVSLSADAADAFTHAKTLYEAVWAWDDPTKGIIPGVGGVESVEDISAPSRVGGPVQLNAKTIVQYTGSWRLAVRNY